MVHQTTATASVGDLVHDLAAAFATSSQLYAQWRVRRDQANHYHKPRTPASGLGSAGVHGVHGVHAGPGPGPGPARCALAASLARGQHVRDVYTAGLAILGSDFSRGDHAARRTLAAQRDLLHDQLAVLRAAVPAAAGPLDLRALLQASEAARVAAVQALADQYRRMALARPGVPRDLPVARWRLGGGGSASGPSSRSASPAPGAPTVAAPSARWLTYLDDDARTTAWSELSGPLVFQSEPPSPPLTPKDAERLPPVPLLPAAFRPAGGAAVSPAVAAALSAGMLGIASAFPGDDSDHRRAHKTDDNTDAESVYTTTTAAPLARPKNSVFNIFCPGAMALQVDVRRPVPADELRCRWCGFRWDGGSIAGTEGGRDSPALVSPTAAAVPPASATLPPATTPTTPSPPGHTLLLKEGFHLSRRFLAKSHCEGEAGSGLPGVPGTPAYCYGCVLCTSTGVAQTYATAEALRGHINAAHSKWQMLHDRDLV